MLSNKAISILSAVILGLGGLFSLHELAYYQKIYPHINIAGVEISNLTIEQATDLLTSASPATPGGLPALALTFGGQLLPLPLNNIDLNYQPRTTAQNAYLIGRSGGVVRSLITKWQLWQKGQQLPYQFSLDETKLVNLVDQVVGQLEERPIVPQLKLKPSGQIELIPGKNGRVIDKGALYPQIYNRLGGLNFEPVEIPVALIGTNISESELVMAQTRAENFKTKQLIVEAPDFRAQISGQDLIDLAGFNLDAKIASTSASFAGKINRPAQNAAFNFDGTRVVEFKPALPGLKLDEAQAIQLIKQGLDELSATTSASHKITLVVETTAPEITTDQVNDLGIKELLGKGESTFHHSIPGRIHKVALTAQRLNGVLVKPGEVFSFNAAVGDISAATGYQSAYIIKNGRTVLGDGGGVCQDSTTVFRAALNAGLEIIERHPHSYRVTYYEQNSPPGVDATVFSPSVDLKFKNDTPGHLLIQTTVNTATQYLKVEIYGTSDGRAASIGNFRLWDQSHPPADLYQDDPTLPAGTIKQVDWAAWGAKAAFDWQVVRDGQTLHQKTFYTNYQPWQAVYLRGVGGA